MRIFVAVRHARDPREYYGGLWSANFYPALKRLGHELVESQTDLLATSRFMHVGGDFTADERKVRSQLTERIVDEVRRSHQERPLDMFLSYFYNSHFDPAGFAEIRRLGIPSVNFYCNSIYQFDLVNEVAPAADFAWHAERDAHDLYRAAGATPVWVQMGADPEVYRPVTDLPRVSAACFVGRRYADRDRWLAALARAGVPVEIYGPGWRRQLSADQDAVGEGTRDQYLGRNTPKAGSVAAYIAALRQNMVVDGPIRGVGRSIRQFGYRWQTRRIEPLFEAYARSAVSFSDMAAVFSAHEVVLNFSNVWADGRPGSALIPHVRLRDFEGPMCRTCYITGHSDELQEFYEVGSEIETYSTSEELVDKTRFYLGNPEAASRLREAGYARAVKDHTWDRRFQQLFSRIGVS